MAAGGTLVGRGYVSIRPEFEGNWSRSASARGQSAGDQFAKSFGRSVSTGLRGVGALAGVAVAANLTNVAGAAAALAPALATAGTAAAALKLGLSGVSEAFKAAFADQTADAKAAASATRAVESAQRGLADAQRSLADARVQAAERIKDAQRAVADAEQDLADTVEDSARRQRDAQLQVRDAERDLRDAQQDARDAQASLTDARREAVRTLEDMTQRLAESRLDEREAVLRLEEAEKALRAAQAKPGTKPQDLERLDIAYERAVLNLQEQRAEIQRLDQDTKKANKAGVNGSDQVRAARERIAQADQRMADRQQGLARAREDAQRAEVDGARAVTDAQQALADAQAGVDKARADGQRQIEDAQRGVADAARALADAQAAAAAQTSKLDQAMAKLAPNAQSFVRAVQGLAPAWEAMRLGVQDRLFSGLDTTVTGLATATIPILQRQLTATAGIWNTIAKNAAGAVSDMARSGMLEDILKGANANLRVFENTPRQLITAFGQLTTAAQPAFNQFLTQLSGAITSFTAGIAKSFASGGLEQAITAAFGLLSQFGTLLGNALGVVVQILKAASDAGGQILGVLGAVFAELKTILAAPEMQAALRSIFTAVATIVGTIAPLIGAVVQQLLPLIAAFTPFIQQITQQFGPVLMQLVSVLGAALAPILSALLPVLFQVSTAIVQIVQSVTPLLQPIADLIAGVIGALAPALTPVIGLITGLVGALVGPLSQVVRALTPLFVQLGQIINQVFAALQPVLAPLVGLIGQAAGLLAGMLAQALQQLMAALAPLLPVGMQLVQTVFGALQPILPVLAAAFGTMVQALSALLTPLSGVAAQLARSLAPVIGDLAPVIGQLAGLLAGALAQALPPLTQTLLILARALSPVGSLLGQVLAEVVGLVGGVLVQLMPALVQLIGATLQLTIAILPLLPALTQIAALVVGFAAAVLSVLLPPLVRLVGFLVGALAGALSTVIGWVAGLVGWVATKLGPVFTWIGRLITTVAGGIVAAFRWLYDVLIGHSILPDIVRYISGPFAAVFRWLRDNVVGPVMSGIRTAISTAWERGIRPAFDAIKTAVGLVADSFSKARDGIGKAWDKIRELTKKPIAWVIDIVYNKGIRGLWNTAAKVLPIEKLPEFKPKGFAFGGPVFGPGTETSDSIPARLSRGEHVWTAKEVRGAGGHEVVEAMRSAARRRAPGFAEGGPVGDIVGAHGGIGDWVTGKIKDVAGKLKDWVLGGVHAAASAAARPIRDLINRIPGGSSGFGQLATALPKGLLTSALDAIRGSEDAQMGSGQWIKPVDVPYGTRFGVSGAMWASGKHTGLDFPAPTGRAVKAVDKGSIAYARSGGPYGNHILVSHGGGLASLYAHLSQIVERSGAVRQGQLIGRVGATGNVTGPHLHLEARLSGQPVDPMPYLTGGGFDAKAVGRNQQTAKGMLGRYGWGQTQFGPLKRLWQHESGWNHLARNPSSGAFGIPQALPGSKMASAGSDWRTNPATQIKWGLGYIKSRYGSPASAWSFWQRQSPHWYDSGGWLPPGLSLTYNGTGQPEPVLTGQQWQAIYNGADGGGAGGGRGGDTYNFYPRTLDMTVQDLELLQRRQEARARVGRPR